MLFLFSCALKKISYSISLLLVFTLLMTSGNFPHVLLTRAQVQTRIWILQS